MKEVERVADKGYSDRVMNHPEHNSISAPLRVFHTITLAIIGLF